MRWKRDAGRAALVGDGYACITGGAGGRILNLEEEPANSECSIDR